MKLISQAAFFIFLFHYFAFGFVTRILFWFGHWGAEDYVWVRFFAGLLLPLMLWIGYTAALRTFVRMRQQGLLPAFLRRTA